MSLTGDFKGLQAVANGLKDAGQNGFRRAMDAARDEVDEQYADGFRGRVDPWGNAWGPKKDGSPATLFQTGDLGSSTASASSGTIRMRPPKHWVFLQVGANRMPQRAVLPFSSSTWDPPIESAIEDAIIGDLP